MKGLFNKTDRDKHLFKSYYCAGCKQRKPCGKLDRQYCCHCHYQNQEARTQAYNTYEEVLASKHIDREKRLRQLQLLKSYSGCKNCRSKEVDAYALYENNRLVCQPCLMSKEGSASSPISFLGERKWYKKRWGVDLVEWLDKYQSLPVNKNCAEQWLKDKQHLKNCQCLEIEAKKIHELFANSLKEMEERLRKCACESSEKVRVSSDYYAWCERCEVGISAASKKRVIKNRNDPKFWGLNIREKVLCGGCLANLVERMPASKKYTFRKYERRGYWKQSNW